MKPKPILSSVLLLTAAIIWGVAFVAQNQLSDTVEPFTVNAVRSFIAAAALTPVAWFTRRSRGLGLFENNKTDRKLLLKASLICGALLCVSVNLQQFGIALYPEGAPVEAHSGFLTAMYILFVPIFGLFMKKRPTLFVSVGVAFAVAGLYFLCLSDGIGSVYAGDILCLLCGMSFAVQILCVDRFIGSVDPVKLSSLQFLVTGILSSILMFIFEKPNAEAILAAWQPLLYLALLSSAVGYTLQILGQKYSSSPTLASILMSMESVFALLGGAVISGVTPKPAELLGCGLMLAAIVIAQIPSKKKDGAG